MREPRTTYPVAYINDITVDQDGQTIKAGATLKENLAALDRVASSASVAAELKERLDELSPISTTEPTTIAEVIERQNELVSAMNQITSKE